MLWETTRILQVLWESKQNSGIEDMNETNNITNNYYVLEIPFFHSSNESDQFLFEQFPLIEWYTRHTIF